MNRTYSLILCLPVTLVVLLLTTRTIPAEDWPQWQGKNRDAICTETGLAKKWPPEGPKLLWKATGLGEGYSGPAIVGKVLYTMGNKDGKVCVMALDTTDGKEIWCEPIGPVEYNGNFPGTRSTPTVDGDRLYVTASGGALAALEKKTGKLVWRKHYVKDFGGTVPRWGYAESVLIDVDRLVCMPGGPKGCVVALDKKTAKTLWASDFRDLASYSSLIIASAGGVKQYVGFSFESVVGVDARDGKLLWRYEEPAHSADWGNVNIDTPVWSDQSVFESSNYEVGSGRAKIIKTAGGFKAEQVYFTKELKNHHGGLILLDGALYGATQPGMLICLDFKTGKVRWRDRKPGKCSLLCADGMLFCRDENGPISLVKATAKEFSLLGRFEQPQRSDQKAWPHLVIANGQMYARDQDNLFCYDVREQ